VALEAVQLHEYGVWGAESPGFLRDLFRFVEGHRRVA